MIPVKQDKSFTITIVETNAETDVIGVEHVLNFDANGNAELTAKAGNFVRQFSEDAIPEWRKSL